MGRAIEFIALCASRIRQENALLLSPCCDAKQCVSGGFGIYRWGCIYVTLSTWLHFEVFLHE